MRALIPLVLVLLAGWFVVRPQPEWPIPARADLGVLSVDPAPLRSLNPTPTILDVGGAPLSCNQCHALFESGERQRLPIGQHQDVVLDHGRNDNCLSCHDQADRELLRSSSGRIVAFEDAQLLCADCHGPTFRDWELGIHGRTMGSWDSARPEQRRLECIECHDPHAPAFDPLPTFPGPRTLRMGNAAVSEVHAGVRNPLRLWSTSAQHDDAESHEDGEAHDDDQHDGEQDEGEHDDG
jgi:hypothetical protein